MLITRFVDSGGSCTGFHLGDFQGTASISVLKGQGFRVSDLWGGLRTARFGSRVTVRSSEFRTWGG